MTEALVRFPDFYQANGPERRVDRAMNLIRYQPVDDADPHACAAIWQEAQQVRLVSPLVRTRFGVIDPQPFIKHFPSTYDLIHRFERAMEWLDSVCYVSRSTQEVAKACDAAPEWGLQCVRYDASDATIGLDGLVRSPQLDRSFGYPAIRYCLVETIRRVLGTHERLAVGQIEGMFDAGAENEVAWVYLPGDRIVLVKFLTDIASTDVVRQGLLALDRRLLASGRYTHSLLVVGGLPLRAPIFLTNTVTISTPDFDQIRAALVGLIDQVAKSDATGAQLSLPHA